MTSCVTQQPRGVAPRGCSPFEVGQVRLRALTGQVFLNLPPADLQPLLPGFRARRMDVGEVRIACEVGGDGPPVLLLHGFPQDRFLWRHLAPALVATHTVVCADLRGYGDSDAPRGGPPHLDYSKRSLAADQVALMRALGFDRFALVGHDRGGRVAHRLALDHPRAIERLALLDIVPTRTVFETADEHLARAYYHWFFLSQPADLPERLIGADPGYFAENCLARWSGTGLTPFGEGALERYRERLAAPGHVHAACEDYRAAATIDLDHDREDDERRIECPALVLWGARGVVHRLYDPLVIWQTKCAGPVTGGPLPCGHFLPEEAPAETLAALRDFLG
jgi:haloacetate dehalogenase